MTTEQIEPIIRHGTSEAGQPYNDIDGLFRIWFQATEDFDRVERLPSSEMMRSRLEEVGLEYGGGPEGLLSVYQPLAEAFGWKVPE